jgi:hypothetical protein
VNTVQELRQVLSAEVTRLQPPAGLEARVLQRALRSSAAVVPAHRDKRRGAVRSWESRPVDAPRLVALVAALLAVAVVLALVLSARALHMIGSVPANHGLVGQGIVVTRVDFQCSLPVAINDLATPAFVQVQLPEGMVVNKSIQPVDRYPQSAFDVQAGRWVPVLSSAISPDGKSWAYGTGMLGGTGQNGTVHVVDAVTGKDRQLWSGTGGAAVLGFLPARVYFVETIGGGEASAGAQTLWVVDPSSPNSAHEIGPMPGWDVSPGVVLLGPSGVFGFVRGGSAGHSERVERMDLTTGDVTSWFTNVAGPNLTELLGLDGQGHPIILTGMAKPRVLLLTAPNRFVEIAGGSNIAFSPNGATGDAHGVWFGEPGSIWLYQPGVGLREVFAMPSTLFPAPSPKTFPPGFPSPPAPTPGAPRGADLTVIGPCT